MARRRLLLWGVSSIASLGSLAAATLDLNLVRSVRATIQGADVGAAADVALAGSQLTPLASIALGNNPSLATIAEVAPAALQLQLVELIRGAMEDADLAVAAATPQPSTTSPAQPDIQTIVDAPRHIQSPPVIEPGQVIHLAPQIRPAVAPAPAASPMSVPPSTGQSRPHHAELYPQPPWHFLPWPHHEAAGASVKRVVAVPDILIKGLLIDLFI